MYPNTPDRRHQSSYVRRLASVGFASTVIALAPALAGCTSSREQSNSTAPTVGASAPVGSTTDVAAIVAEPTTTEPAATVPETTTTAAPTTTTTSLPTTTTTTIPLVTEGAIVIVANATNLEGGAGAMTEKLAAAGYHMASATNTAGGEEFRDTTIIYFLPAGEAVATSVAMVMGASIARMPTPAPINDATAGLGEATVLVMLGRDLVGETPPGLEGR